jgi:ribonucleoside-triphosphate reductase
MTRDWSNLARIVYRRTYSRVQTNGSKERWHDTVQRSILGNIRGHNVPDQEVKDLVYLAQERKAIPAGRGLWFSGTEAHQRIGGVALNNCWYLDSSDWHNFVVAQDLLMLGGGVGLSVEHRYTSKLPKVKKDVSISHRQSKDTDFIIPDTREGWCELTNRVLESYLSTGKSFSYSTVCVRGYGEDIKGFGGTASGPLPLIRFVENLCSIFRSREGRHLRPIDTADIITATGEMVVAGNVRRSAIIILGDCWDKEYLKAKRWDLGSIPSYRACANYSVVCDDVDDLHPLFWKTFEQGEAFGIVNRKNIQKFGRMGELKRDTAEGVNPCAEATLEPFEPCNLQEIALPNIDSEQEFILAARLMHRYGKRVTMEHYHHDEIEEVIHRNRRVGTSITGCLASPLFKPETLDRAYQAIQLENVSYSKELGIPESIRTTVVKPSGTVSKVLDMDGYEGIHPAFSRYIIQRIRFAANDALIPLLREAGHYMEPVKKLDGSLDHGTLVVDFYVKAPDGFPVADEDFDTWKQLDVLRMAQKHWADQAVSVSVYYKRDEIPKIKEWLRNNIGEIKTISFLAASDHGFVQAPKEKITQEQYEKLSASVKPIDEERIGEGKLEDLECAGGVCPVK